MKYLKKNWLLLLCFYFLSCQGQNPVDKESLYSVTNFSLPEPAVFDTSLKTGKPRFTFTQVSRSQKKFLKITDNIVFNSQLKGVNLTINTHCLIDNDKVITRTYHRPFSPSIPLIELLPKEMFLSKKKPSCSFNFSAKNPAGSRHYFELPHLPIQNHTHQRFMEIVDGGRLENAEKSPYVFLKRKKDYTLSLAPQKKADSLNLQCDGFSRTLKVRAQEQFVPLAGFSFDEEKESDVKRYHECRIFAYHKKTLLSISKTFTLVKNNNYLPSIHVGRPEDLADKPGRKSKRSPQYYIDRFKDGFQSHSLRDSSHIFTFYFYEINNPHSYPVYLFIEGYKEDKEHLNSGSDIDIYGIYGGKNVSFYEKHRVDAGLGKIETKKGSVVKKQEKQGLFVKMDPKSEIHIPLKLWGFWLCNQRNLRANYNRGHYLGLMFEYPDVKIQALSVASTQWSEDKSLLNVEKGKFRTLLTYRLEQHEVDHPALKFENLWFPRTNCRGEDIEHYAEDNPLLQLRQHNPRDIRFQLSKVPAITIGNMMKKVHQSSRIIGTYLYPPPPPTVVVPSGYYCSTGHKCLVP